MVNLAGPNEAAGSDFASADGTCHCTLPCSVLLCVLIAAPDQIFGYQHAIWLRAGDAAVSDHLLSSCKSLPELIRARASRLRIPVTWVHPTPFQHSAASCGSTVIIFMTPIRAHGPESGSFVATVHNPNIAVLPTHYSIISRWHNGTSRILRTVCNGGIEDDVVAGVVDTAVPPVEHPLFAAKSLSQRTPELGAPMTLASSSGSHCSIRWWLSHGSD